MAGHWCEDPMKLKLFWAVVLVLLILVLLKVWGIKEKQSNREYRQKNPYSSGATQRFAQSHETPYLQNCIDYVYEMKTDEDRKTIDSEEKRALDAPDVAADAAALATSNALPAVAANAAEYLSGTRGYAAVDNVRRKQLGPHEHMTASRDGPVHWFIGDNIQDMKNEISGQTPDLDTNRWTMQMQNQISDLRSDTVEGNLVEDTLFRRSVANM